ncbi:hypothetical protein HDV02_001149 [Globomyces sp. JEL0801]|nr:hypothetical protein HDV02_001149 [Globomyces sp. JEL0801]
MYTSIVALLFALSTAAPSPAASFDQVKQVFPTYMAYSSTVYCQNLFDDELDFDCGHKCEVAQIKNSKLALAQYDKKSTNAGYVAHNPDLKTIVVVFRGTATVQSVITDLKLWKCNTSWKNVQNAKLHFGFLEAFNKIKSPLLAKALELASDPQYKDYQINFTGHSLGGALALLAATDFYEANPQYADRISLFSYGQPRVGNKEFARYINKLPFASRIYRIARRVPHLPFSSMGFEHTTNHISLLGNNVDAVQCASDFPETGESSECMNDFWETNPLRHLIYYESMSNPFNCWY